MVEFAELNRLSIRDVWKGESTDFTPWLADNLQHLSDRIGVDLELIDTEVAVGPFKVDLVARITGSEDLVVIENQFGPTDHDHLGKLLTYAAGQDAAYAVWIAETFRPEHRSALEWANRNSIEGVGYFGLRVEALQIGQSPVAVQLVSVVEPDQWAKQAPNLTESPRAQLYREFWTPVLEGIKERYPGWTSSTTPSKASWMTLPSGRSYPWYSIAFTYDTRLRIELYVDGPDEPTQRHYWKQFVEQRQKIDTAVPAELTWEALEDKKASRIAWYYDQPATVDDRENWPDFRAWILDSLGPFRDAVQPHIDTLDTTPPEPSEEQYDGP